MSEWIDVSDRFPEEGKVVDMHLIRRVAGAVIHSFRYDHWHPGKHDGKNRMLLLTHWRDVEVAPRDQVMRHWERLSDDPV